MEWGGVGRGVGREGNGGGKPWTRRSRRAADDGGDVTPPLRLTLFAAQHTQTLSAGESVLIFTPRICARGHSEPARTTCGTTNVAASPRPDGSRRGRARGRRRADVEPAEARRRRVLRRARVTRLGFPARPRFTLPSDALNTSTAHTLYLLIVFVITARTVALTLIKVQLNKTKTENNHFCLTGKMARYVAEAMTTHAPLAKHMFFRPELCAGLMHRVGSAAPRGNSVVAPDKTKDSREL